MASFGRLPSGVLAKGGGMGEGGGVVPYLHHAWLSRQYLSFGEVIAKAFIKGKGHGIFIVGTMCMFESRWGMFMSSTLEGI